MPTDPENNGAEIAPLAVGKNDGGAMPASVVGMRPCMHRQWKAQPLPPPVVDTLLERRNAIERSVEVLRYSIFSLEFWIFPGGQFREWLRHNVRLLAWLAVPVLLLAPIIGVLLTQINGWLTQLVEIAQSLIRFPLLALAAVLVLLLVIRIICAIFGLSR